MFSGYIIWLCTILLMARFSHCDFCLIFLLIVIVMIIMSLSLQGVVFYCGDRNNCVHRPRREGRPTASDVTVGYFLPHLHRILVLQASSQGEYSGFVPTAKRRLARQSESFRSEYTKAKIGNYRQTYTCMRRNRGT